MSKFKVGDRVKVVPIVSKDKKTFMTEFLMGQISLCTFTLVEGSDGDLVIEFDGKKMKVDLSWLVLAKETPIEKEIRLLREEIKS